VRRPSVIGGVADRTAAVRRPAEVRDDDTESSLTYLKKKLTARRREGSVDIAGTGGEGRGGRRRSVSSRDRAPNESNAVIDEALLGAVVFRVVEA